MGSNILANSYTGINQANDKCCRGEKNTIEVYCILLKYVELTVIILNENSCSVWWNNYKWVSVVKSSKEVFIVFQNVIVHNWNSNTFPGGSTVELESGSDWWVVHSTTWWAMSEPVSVESRSKKENTYQELTQPWLQTSCSQSGQGQWILSQWQYTPQQSHCLQECCTCVFQNQWWQLGDENMLRYDKKFVTLSLSLCIKLGYPSSLLSSMILTVATAGFTITEIPLFFTRPRLAWNCSVGSDKLSWRMGTCTIRWVIVWLKERVDIIVLA